MREKLNENPIAQVALVGVLVVAAAFLLLGGMGGGEESSPSAASTTASSTTGSSGESATSGGESSAGAETADAGATSPTGAASESAAAPVSVPAPPLPAPVSAAYKANKTVVLLVVHPGGIEDRIVAAAVGRLRSDSGLALFVIPARRIARYAAITLGLDVEQVPALIVMRPRHLSGGTPQASLSYGFQTPQSVVQAVRDATYKGREVPYYPN